MTAAQLFQIVLTAAASVMCGVVMLYLKSIKFRLDTQDTRIEKLKDNLSQTYVDKVDYIRNVTHLENMLGELVVTVNEMKGTMKIIEQIPKITGNIVREVVKEMKS